MATADLSDVSKVQQILLDATPALLSYIDASFRYRFVNKAYERWFRVGRHEIVDRHVREVLGEKTWEKVRPHMERALAGEPTTYEEVLPYSRGGSRNVRVTYTPHRDETGVRGFSVLVDDVTNRMRNERLIAQTQRMASVGSWILALDDMEELDRNRLEWSDQTFVIFGYAPGSVPVTNDLFFSAIYPEDRPMIQEAVAVAIDNGTPYEVEHRIRLPSGEERIVHQWGEVLFEDDGRPREILGAVQDVTDQRRIEQRVLEAANERARAEEAMTAARGQLQLVMDTLPVFVARCSADGRFLWVNRAHAARFGMPPEAFVGRRIDEMLGERAYAVIRPYVERVLAGEQLVFEVAVPYEELGTRWMSAVYAPTFDAAGQPNGWVAVVMDTSERKRLEQERERAIAELRESDRRKDEFLAMLAHELRNPLSPILTAVELLGHHADNPELARYLAVIGRQVSHMRRLLDDLLDVARVSRGKIDLCIERLDLGAVLLQAVEVSRPLIASKQHQLGLSLPGSPMTMDGDATRLTQVFANLLNNAAKYTPDGGHITLEAHCEDGAALVRVRDDGVGLAPDMLEHIFELFVQSERTLARSEGGLGVGLTLVRSLVLMHGGEVRAASEGLGRGTELEVRLPIVAHADAAEEKVATKPPPRGMRVLVVDDNVDFAQTMSSLLEKLGYEAAIAYDGAHALAMAASGAYDIMLIDLGLPEVKGIEVARRLRERGVTSKLVAVSGYGQDQDVRAALAAGFDAHLTKPVSLAELEPVLAG